MPYSDEDFAEIQRDPVRLRAYFWHVAQYHKRLAREYRNRAKSVSYDEGYKLIENAEVSESFAEVILEKIDALVETCVVRD